MKNNLEEQERSGLLIGSEPLSGIEHRSASKTDDNDAGKDNPLADTDESDSDGADSDGTDGGDKGADGSDADGRD